MERAGTDPRFPPAVPDEDLVNALAQYLQLDPLERQALLERDGVLDRCRGLIELLEMKSLTGRAGGWTGRAVH
jgi:Lon protease-like protein